MSVSVQKLCLNDSYYTEAINMITRSSDRQEEVLIVQPDLFEARRTLEMMRHWDQAHRLTLMRDGDEALEFLRREGKFTQAPCPTVIILDSDLPGADVEKLIHHIRVNPTTQDVPVFGLVSSDEWPSPLVDQVLVKPAQAAEFIGALDRTAAWV